jgi:glycosyltransferase involved in cell wall biosynthesis
MKKDSPVTPVVSIIVPCYNEESTVEALLDAIYSQTYPISNMEVIIADGMSHDGTRSVIRLFRESHPEIQIHIIDNPKRNIPSALNLAIRASQGEVVIRLDAHSAPAPDYVEQCVTTLIETNAANVGGLWNIKPKNRRFIARGIAAAASHPLGAGDARYRIGGDAGEVDTVPFGAFRREWIKKVGLFNESLLTNEDYEYNTRIRNAGGLIWFSPSIQSTYFARSTFSELAKQYFRYGYWKARMLRDFPKTLRWRQILPPTFILAIAFSLLMSFLYTPLIWLFVALISVYFGVTVVFGIMASIREQDVGMAFSFPIALWVMHLTWGLGFLSNSVRVPIHMSDNHDQEA